MSTHGLKAPLNPLEIICLILNIRPMINSETLRHRSFKDFAVLVAIEVILLGFEIVSVKGMARTLLIHVL
jgi:hypothetical protein